MVITMVVQFSCYFTHDFFHRCTGSYGCVMRVTMLTIHTSKIICHYTMYDLPSDNNKHDFRFMQYSSFSIIQYSVLFSIIQRCSVLFSIFQHYSVFFSIIQYYSAGSAFSIVSTYFNNLRASILRFGLRHVTLLLEPSRDSTSQKSQFPDLPGLR